MAGHFPQSIGPSVFAMWNEFYNTEYAGDAALAPGPVASDRDEQTPTCRPGRGRRTGRTGLFRMVSTRRDRKSTRLNSSHLVISDAVFCLKKQKHSIHYVRS